MRVEAISDPVRFQELALPALSAEPVRHIAVLSWIRWRTGVAGTDPMLIVYDGDAVAGAVLVVGGEAYLGDLHDDLVEPVTRKLAELVPELAAVEATPAVVEAFGRHWQRLRGAAGRQTVAKRLQRLDTLVPHTAPGEPRLAGPDDQELCTRWADAFAIDCGDPPADRAPGVAQAIGEGRRWLWELDGEPVSAAGTFATIAGTTRIGPVYTPPAHRGCGYAGALTSYVSQLIQSRGEQACLYSDLANRTSTELYARLGFTPVADLIHLDLRA